MLNFQSNSYLSIPPKKTCFLDLCLTNIFQEKIFLVLLPLFFSNEFKIGELTQFSQPLHSKQANYSVFMQAATVWQTLAIDGYC